MDEELFRNYFVKLYRKIVQMEAQFLNLLLKEDRDAFVLYSKSVKEIAQNYKVYRDPEHLMQGSYIKKKEKHSRDA